MVLKRAIDKRKTGSDNSSTTIMEPHVTPKHTRKRETPRARSKLGDRLRSLMVLFALMILITTGLVGFQMLESRKQTDQVAVGGKMQMLVERIVRSSFAALDGNTQGFDDLRAASAQFSGFFEALDRGSAQTSSVPDTVRPELGELGFTWRKINNEIQLLLEQQKDVVQLVENVDKINSLDQKLFEMIDLATAFRLRANNINDIENASQLLMLTQRIAKNANILRIADAADAGAAFSLGKDLVTFRETLPLVTQIPVPDVSTSELEATSEEMLQAVESILDQIQLLVRAKKAGGEIYQQSNDLAAKTSRLVNALSSPLSFASLLRAAIAICALIDLILLVLMVLSYQRSMVDRREESDRLRMEAESQTKSAQQAILRLMNEMGNLADGDLTVRATVTEDITGAVADSVNYAIEELAVLVRRINDAAIRVTTATETAQKTSAELLSATEQQSLEIKDAGATAQQMAQSMSNSSERALESAQVARRSLESVHKGNDAVEVTIKGMNEIREQIQETSKRIKRLGESSQEIGEIVELISDITEQTNVLALNAAIQAASAGEAGRGFTVVAEEVQRLAERSAEATKQISAIVKAIQADTQDAVAAMESATQDVVEGAKRTDAAGQALAEIGQVSLEAAQLIEQVSTDTQQQAAAASRVASTMSNILSITEQTTRGTKQTATSVGQLADLAVELKGSVSGFKV